MSEENDQAAASEESGKAALEAQKAADAEKIAAIQAAAPTEESNEARKAADEAEAKAQQEADDAAQDAYQAEAAAAQQARMEALKAQQEADAEAQAAFQAEEEAAQQARMDALKAAQEAFAADEKAAREEAEAERRKAAGDERTAEEVEADRLAYEEELKAGAKAAAEDMGEGHAADEDEISLEETTALEDLEQTWGESGVMGVYSNRVDLLNKLTSNWFSWFPPVRRFPEVNFNFLVMAGLDFLGEFKAVSGITKSLPSKRINEGGRNHSPHYLPFDGPASRGELTLEWGSVSATSLYDWIEAVRIGWAFHRDVIVVQLARDGWPTRFMRFGGCWPTGWKGADLDTSGSSWALQSLSLVYDDFNMITVPVDLGAWSRKG